MKMSTREKMVVGAADLIRRRGVNSTSVREVVRHTHTPRGSISHHFPDGKLQLVEEALRFAAAEVSVPLARLVAGRGSVLGLRAFVELWRDVLESSGYEAGCPIVAVAIEQYLGEDGAPNPSAQERLLRIAQATFQEWRDILAASLAGEGMDAARAERLATMIVASIEGTIALCRAGRSTAPLDAVLAELELAIVAALPSAPVHPREGG